MYEEFIESYLIIFNLKKSSYIIYYRYYIIL